MAEKGPKIQVIKLFTQKSIYRFSSQHTSLASRKPCISWPTMEVRLKQTTFAEIAAIEFCVFLVMGIEVARQKIPENGRKWQKIHVILNRRHLPKMAGNGFPRISRHGHRGRKRRSGRQQQKMAENGIPRVSRQSPTTPYQHIRMY